MASILISGKHQSIKINFQYNGKIMRESSGYFCNGKGEVGCKCEGCNNARIFAEAIGLLIKIDKFDYLYIFPHTKNKQIRDIYLEREKVSEQEINNDITFKIFSEYVFNKLLNESALNKITVSKYRSALVDIFPLLNDIPVKDITQDMLEEILKSLNKRRRSYIQAILKVLNKIFEYALSRGLINKHPCRNIDVSSIVAASLGDKTINIEPFNVKQIEEILEYVQEKRPELVLLFAMSFYTGVPLSVLLDLKKEDIDLNKRCFIIKQDRYIYIPQILEKYIVFHNKYNTDDDLFNVYKTSPAINSNKDKNKEISSVCQTWRRLSGRLSLPLYGFRNITHYSFICNCNNQKFPNDYIKNSTRGVTEYAWIEKQINSNIDFCII